MSTNNKVTRKELATILGVSINTAYKEYQTIIDSLGIRRTYLTVNDLVRYGVI